MLGITASRPQGARSGPVTFRGVEIPADSWVLFGIAGANRDPATFADPDRFDIGRDQKAGLTFGRGVKNCPGMHLARRNLQVGLGSCSNGYPRSNCWTRMLRFPVDRSCEAPTPYASGWAADSTKGVMVIPGAVE